MKHTLILFFSIIISQNILARDPLDGTGIDYFRLDGGISYQTAKFDVNFNVNNITNRYLYSGAPYGTMYYWQTEPGINSRITVFYKF